MAEVGCDGGGQVRWRRLDEKVEVRCDGGGRMRWRRLDAKVEEAVGRSGGRVQG